MGRDERLLDPRRGGNFCPQIGKILPPTNHNGGAMRVNGPNETALASAPATAGRASTPRAVSPCQRQTATNNNRRLSLRTVGGIDALIALQGIEDPPERRRAVKHGRRALDALDELKLALLAGTLESWALLRLRTVAADLKPWN